MRDILGQSLRFLAVGLANTTIGLLAIYFFLYFFDTGPGTANAIGYAIGLIVSFGLNRVWTFRDRRSIREVLPRYIAVAAVCYLMNLSVVLIGTSVYSINKYWVQLLGIGIYTTTMFWGCRTLVFRAKQDARTE